MAFLLEWQERRSPTYTAAAANYVAPGTSPVCKKSDCSRGFLHTVMKFTAKACRPRGGRCASRPQLDATALYLCGTAVDKQLNAGDVAGIV